ITTIPTAGSQSAGRPMVGSLPSGQRCWSSRSYPRGWSPWRRAVFDLFLPGDLVRLEHGSLAGLDPLRSRAGLVLMVSFTHTHLRLPNLTPADLMALKAASDRLCL